MLRPLLINQVLQNVAKLSDMSLLQPSYHLKNILPPDVLKVTAIRLCLNNSLASAVF